MDIVFLRIVISITVSLVFELLRAFALALLKMSSGTTGLSFMGLLNTEKSVY